MIEYAEEHQRGMKVSFDVRGYSLNEVTLDGVAAEVTLDVGRPTVSDARPMILS